MIKTASRVPRFKGGCTHFRCVSGPTPLVTTVPLDRQSHRFSAYNCAWGAAAGRKHQSTARGSSENLAAPPVCARHAAGCAPTAVALSLRPCPTSCPCCLASRTSVAGDVDGTFPHRLGRSSWLLASVLGQRGAALPPPPPPHASPPRWPRVHPRSLWLRRRRGRDATDRCGGRGGGAALVVGGRTRSSRRHRRSRGEMREGAHTLEQELACSLFSSYGPQGDGRAALDGRRRRRGAPSVPFNDFFSKLGLRLPPAPAVLWREQWRRRGRAAPVVPRPSTCRGAAVAGLPPFPLSSSRSPLTPSPPASWAEALPPKNMPPLSRAHRRAATMPLPPNPPCHSR